MDVFVSKDLNLNSCELAVMLVLNYLQTDKHDFIYTDVNQIGYVLTGRLINLRNKDKSLVNNRDRTISKNIKKGLESLIKHKHIKMIEQNNSTYVISNKDSKIKVDSKEGNFITIELWELQAIFRNNEKDKDISNPFILLMFFINLIGTINNNTKEWHMSQDDMVASFGGSKSTINEYLRQLEKLQLIYVYRPNKRRSDGTFHNINNSYGRYADKDKIISAAKSYIENIECEDIKSKLDRRSISLRYNAFVNGSKKYKDNQELVLQLFYDCIKYNESLKNNPISNRDFSLKDGLDLSEFDKYTKLKELDECLFG